MISELLDLEPLGAELVARARAAGALLIWRAQERLVRSAVVREGRPESSNAVSVSGHAAQVVTEEGHGALASRDDLRPEPALEVLERVLAAASAGPALGLERNALPELEPVRRSDLTGDRAAFESVDLPAVARRLAELEV